ncbi:hypothetical protein THII_1758 [Thioploca ingrica]|uniref:Uncharacterized protein n=1 Tax=Thioploca ingrica TaxID=40754 RepID=A0A090ALN7_9GAMM|nr:hypothetical protein THII_1758 [Thioploca ingrica]
MVYAGAAGLILEPTPGNEHNQIKSALERLTAGVLPTVAKGIQLLNKRLLTRVLIAYYW